MPNCFSSFRAVEYELNRVTVSYFMEALVAYCSPLSSQQLLKMREELKQREAELERSLEDKQQLKNQVQNLKEGLQNLQNTHVMQVSFTVNTF